MSSWAAINTISGFVGIGTPANSTNCISLYTSTTSSSNQAIITSTTNFANIQFNNNNLSNAYIGIGCTNITGNYLNNMFLQADKGIIFNTGGNIFSTSVPSMIISSTGNIGIGSSTPNTKLDITGVINIKNSTNSVPSYSSAYGGTGDRIVFLNGTSGTTYPYSVGINTNSFWYSVPSGATHDFYVNGIAIAQINSTGLITNSTYSITSGSSITANSLSLNNGDITSVRNINSTGNITTTGSGSTISGSNITALFNLTVNSNIISSNIISSNHYNSNTLTSSNLLINSTSANSIVTSGGISASGLITTTNNITTTGSGSLTIAGSITGATLYINNTNATIGISTTGNSLSSSALTNDMVIRNSQQLILQSGTSGGALIITTANNLTINNNVGIGTAASTTGGNCLTIYTTVANAQDQLLITGTSTGGIANIKLNNGTTSSFIGLGGATYSGNYATNLYLQSPKSLIFNINGNNSSSLPTMIIASNSNVGIGTTNPYTIFHMKGTNPILTITGQSGNSAISQIDLATYDTLGTTNKSPCSLIAIGDGNYGSSFQINQTTPGAYQTTQVISFYISSAGKIGIGTTTNLNSLVTINGTASITNSIGIGTTATGNTGDLIANNIISPNYSININYYPPAQLTNNSTTISGQPYGNGGYTISASSTSNVSILPYKTFNLLNDSSSYITNLWRTVGGLYDTTTNGAYTKTTVTNIAGVATYGEYIQVLADSPGFIATGISIVLYSLISSSASKFIIVGTNDTSYWTLLYTQSTAITPTTESKGPYIFTWTNTTQYTYYRLIITAISILNTSGTKTIDGSASITNLIFFNTNNTNLFTNIIIGSNLSINNRSTSNSETNILKIDTSGNLNTSGTITSGTNLYTSSNGSLFAQFGNIGSSNATANSVNYTNDTSLQIVTGTTLNGIKIKSTNNFGNIIINPPYAANKIGSIIFYDQTNASTAMIGTMTYANYIDLTCYNYTGSNYYGFRTNSNLVVGQGIQIGYTDPTNARSTAGTNALTVNGTSYFINSVGIGNTNPKTALDIQGVINVSNINGTTALPNIGTYGGSGDRIILYPAASTSAYPYSIGIAANNLWYSVPSGVSHNFYVNGSSILQINSTGLSTSGITATSLTLNSTDIISVRNINSTGLIQTSGNIICNNNSSYVVIGGTTRYVSANLTIYGSVCIFSGRLTISFSDITYTGGGLSPSQIAEHEFFSLEGNTINADIDGVVDGDLIINSQYGTTININGVGSGDSSSYASESKIPNTTSFTIATRTNTSSQYFDKILFTVRNSGYVGIGNTNPGTALDINGVINVSNVGGTLAGPINTTAYGGAGDRIILYPGIAASTFPYSIGMNTNTMWFSVPKNGTFLWSSNTTSTTINSNMYLDNTGSLNVYNDISCFTSASDIKLKENIKPLGLNCVDLINKFKPVEFTWKDIKDVPGDKINTIDYGFIAQEIEELLPHLIKETTCYKTIKYEKFAPYLVKAIQELSNTIFKLENKIYDLTTEIEIMKKNK